MNTQQSQDHRIDLAPNRVSNTVCSIALLLLAVIPASTSGVGESGLRGKLIFGLVLLALGSADTIYLLVKALPRLRLATSTRCGWKIGFSGLLTAALAVVVLVGGLVLTGFATSDFASGPVTDTVTFVGNGTFRDSRASERQYGYPYRMGHRYRYGRSAQAGAYYEFRTDSGRTFRIGLPNGYDSLMPEDLEPGSRVTMTYYPRTKILVPNPQPRLAD